MTQEAQKQAAAQAALAYIEDDTYIGVGTGSTVRYFIDALEDYKHRIEGAVASSVQTEKMLTALGIPVVDLNSAHPLALYVDGADEVDAHKRMIKGGGAALTREKIIASAAQKFVCIVDASKRVDVLGRDFPLPIEVIPMARSYVAREIVKLGGDPNYREGVVTDNGNCILDVYHLNITDPIQLEQRLNDITGVVCHGLFGRRHADVVLVADENGVKTF